MDDQGATDELTLARYRKLDHCLGKHPVAVSSAAPPDAALPYPIGSAARELLAAGLRI